MFMLIFPFLFLFLKEVYKFYTWDGKVKKHNDNHEEINDWSEADILWEECDGYGWGRCKKCKMPYGPGLRLVEEGGFLPRGYIADTKPFISCKKYFKIVLQYPNHGNGFRSVNGYYCKKHIHKFNEEVKRIFGA